MTAHPDVIVVGLGAMGTACCRALAARGARVLGLERFDLPHALGSSGGQSRIVRMAYFEHPDYVPLLRRAYAEWDALGEALGTTLFHRTGLLYAGAPDGFLLAGVRASAEAHGVHVESLDAHAVAERFPELRPLPGHRVLFEPDAGLALAEDTVAGQAELAMRDGAELRCREVVTGWSAGPDGVQVRTDRGDYRAGHVVFTAGAWSGRLLADLGVPLTVTRQPLAWLSPQAPEAFALGRFPCWVVEDQRPGPEASWYGFPSLPAGPFGGQRGFKLAWHKVGPPADPDTLDRTPTPADVEALRPHLRRFLPRADGPVLGMKICMYTVTPDGHFVVDRHPEHERVTVGCGFSGHGFKLAPAVGVALADLALDGRTALPIGFLGLARFSG